MPELVFFLEEISAKEFLRHLLPRMFPEGDIRFVYKVYEGKQDMQQHLARDMREYARKPRVRFLVLHDQDLADCLLLKERLRLLCREWLDRLFIRIVCRELESWYLAQLDAVETAFAVTNLASRQHKAKFRQPDRLGTPDLILNKLLKPQKKIYSKINGSRLLGKHIDPDCSRSSSFGHFIHAVRQLVQTLRSEAQI